MALDFGHDQMRLFLLDQGLELGRIAHGDGAGMVGHLLAGGVFITVNGHRLHAQTLQRNQDLLAQFA